jgi:hypothetical protein
MKVLIYITTCYQIVTYHISSVLWDCPCNSCHLKLFDITRKSYGEYFPDEALFLATCHNHIISTTLIKYTKMWQYNILLNISPLGVYNSPPTLKAPIGRIFVALDCQPVHWRLEAAEISPHCYWSIQSILHFHWSKNFPSPLLFVGLFLLAGRIFLCLIWKVYWFSVKVGQEVCKSGERRRRTERWRTGILFSTSFALHYS